MKIEYEGRTYEFDITRLSVEECEAIEKFCSARGMGDWSNQLQAANTKALQALWWTIRRQAGENPGAIAVRDPALLPLRLNEAYIAAELAELKAAQAAGADEPEPDPTSPAASSPARSASTPTPLPAAAATPSLPG